MPKRKRASPSPGPTDSISRQKKLCTRCITTAQKKLVSALRLGAGFERQKYSRRRKTAKDKKDDKALERLDAEYAVLKTLDIPKVAEQHLRKTIAKVKSLREAEGLPDEVRVVEKVEGGRDSLWLNVTARLWKVKDVRECVDGCIEELKGIVGGNKAEKGDKVDKKGKEADVRPKEAKTAEDEEEEEEEGDFDVDDLDDEVLAAFNARIAAPSSGEEDSEDELSDGHRPPSVVDSDAENYELGDLEDEESESSAEDSDAAIPRQGYILTDQDDDESADDESISGEESEDDSIPVPKAKTKTKAKGPPSTSTFLPSLSHAGYYSGTDSEASDLEDDRPKKNRRGQRARQKIWEAKYGEKAKHVYKEDRNSGWDAKKGAVDDKGGRARGGRGPVRSGENAIELGPKKAAVKKRDDVGTLHPSWLAAKAAKEKKLMAKPAGTKIVFD